MSIGISIIDEIFKVPVDMWAKMWCDFNTWNFPEEIIHVKPIWWLDNNDALLLEKKSMFISMPMITIESRVGHKACLRQWNIDRMSDEEFEEFWTKNYANGS